MQLERILPELLPRKSGKGVAGSNTNGELFYKNEWIEIKYKE